MSRHRRNRSFGLLFLFEEQLPAFIVIRSCAMKLFLSHDVRIHILHAGSAHRERSVTCLPCERHAKHTAVIDPVGRFPFGIMKNLPYRPSRIEAEEDVKMVRHTIDRKNGRTLDIAELFADMSVQCCFNGRKDQRLAVFRTEDGVDIDLDERWGHCSWSVDEKDCFRCRTRLDTLITGKAADTVGSIYESVWDDTTLYLFGQWNDFLAERGMRSNGENGKTVETVFLMMELHGGDGRCTPTVKTVGCYIE